MADNRIVLLGPPGAGKGTQAHKLCEALHVAHLSTGDILRSAIVNQTPVGKQAKPYMDAGKLVPDEVVIGVLLEAIDQVTAQGGTGYVLDGFPRTMRQAEELKKVLAKRHEKIDRVILIDTKDDVIIDRLVQRRSCPDPKCGKVYNLKTWPPRTAGQCDICGKPLIVRSDDKPETIKVRQHQYWHDTQPLIDYYRRAGQLFEVDGNGAMYDVAQAIYDAATMPLRRSSRMKKIDPNDLLGDGGSTGSTGDTGGSDAKGGA